MWPGCVHRVRGRGQVISPSEDVAVTSGTYPDRVGKWLVVGEDRCPPPASRGPAPQHRLDGPRLAPTSETVPLLVRIDVRCRCRRAGSGIDRCRDGGCTAHSSSPLTSAPAATTSLGQCTPSTSRLAPTTVAAPRAAVRTYADPPGTARNTTRPAPSPAYVVCLDGKLAPSGTTRQIVAGGRGRPIARQSTARPPTPTARALATRPSIGQSEPEARSWLSRHAAAAATALRQAAGSPRIVTARAVAASAGVR